MRSTGNKIIKDTCSTEAFFLNTDAGRLFSLYFSPVSSLKGSILFIPPFMEEMNRSRDLVVAQARKFVSIGYCCLILDLYGTGDSEGDLDNADWSIWQKNILAAADWLEQQNRTDITLWGLRLGCLLAADIAGQDQKRFNHLIMWQPIINGKQYLTQTLRLRMAYLMGHDRPPEKTEDMRKTLQAGEIVEIAGYSLPGPLAVEMDEKKIAECKNIGHCRVDWFEHVSAPDDGFSISVQKTKGKLACTGTKIFLHPFQSPQFWQMSDRTYAPDLIEKTTKLLNRLGHESY